MMISTLWISLTKSLSDSFTVLSDLLYSVLTNCLRVTAPWTLKEF